MKYIHLYALLLIFVFCTSCKGQNKTELPKENIKSEIKEVIISHGPKTITRNIIQDKKGNIYIASWQGVFRYDARLPDGQGKSFTNITSKVSSSHFFSVLEDRKGNFWFGSIGSGVYYYDGKSFQNFTTREGLPDNSVTCIYEDKTGNIWFGTGGGASRYDGKSLPTGQAGFRNFTTREGLPTNDINSIIEDKTGKFWFGTWGGASVYDGKTFTPFTHNGKPFINVRTIIEDKKGNIWLGGNDGLWRYDGKTFTNFIQNFVGYIMEDKKGNIWTSSERENSQAWALSRYDGKSLSDKKPTVTEITSIKEMICGILEANDGSIWFGAADGVYSYDGNTITDFKDKEVQK
jgi:ligand-binding sensor domain-containing protein